MQPEHLENVAAMRAAVGFLGEKEQAGWWPSSFFGIGSTAFLSPLFPRTHFLAQCQGVTCAASRKHDERIGVGQVYHLFRLPEDIEQGIHHLLHSVDIVDRLKEIVGDQAAALRFLQKDTVEAMNREIGPTYMAPISSLRDPRFWGKVAAKYSSGFDRGSEIYPYFADRK